VVDDAASVFFTRPSEKASLGLPVSMVAAVTARAAAVAPDTPEPVLALPAPAHVIVDARPGDAAARLLRRRLIAAAGDRAPLAAGTDTNPLAILSALQLNRLLHLNPFLAEHEPLCL